MGKIYYIIGKSASGKDTMYKRLMELRPKLRPVIPYTTRPIRRGEQEGVEYHFTTPEELEKLAREGKVIEQRTYETAHGPWTYATVDDGQMKLAKHDYVIIGTLESFLKTQEYFGYDAVKPLYLELDPAIRLQRALNRELMQKEPKYTELCRRFIADEEDFSEDKIYAAGIKKRYVNEDLNRCVQEILEDIDKEQQ